MDRYFKALLEEIGENPRREGLRDTPRRTAKALKFLTQGYGQKLEDIVGRAIFTSKNDEMVIVRDIELYSLCEHHMLPFIGRAHVAYLPNRKVIGLSKIPRIVDLFARRFQVQERLTEQVADALVEVLEPKGVVVIAEARHLCMAMRGVQKQHSSTITRATRGAHEEVLLAMSGQKSRL